MTRTGDAEHAEARFRAVFAHLGEVTAYARRRGSPDPDSVAAEAMTIAWRRLADVPRDDPRPWLYATTRNLVLAEWHRRPPSAPADLDGADELDDRFEPGPQVHALDPQLLTALRSLSSVDREALLLIAWEDLSPTLAAKTVGVTQAAFRVRLHRARRRLREALSAAKDPLPAMHAFEVERR